MVVTGVELRVFFLLFFSLLPSFPLSPDCMRDTCLPASRPLQPPCPPSHHHPPSKCACSPAPLPSLQGPSQDGAAHSQLQLQQQQNKTRTKDLKEEILCSSSAIFFIFFFASSLERRDMFDLSKLYSACATVVFDRKIEKEFSTVVKSLKQKGF